MEISLAGQILFHIGSFPVTNTILTSWIVTVIILISGVTVGISFKKLPSSVQQAWEMIYEYLEDLAVSIAGKRGKDYVPLSITFFIYILLNNWLELIPGVGSIGINLMENGEKVFTPLIRSATSDINTTLALALISVTVTQLLGIKASGILGHLKHFINPMEIISELSKLVSFSFRLFGNMFAGDVLLAAGASLLVLITGTTHLWYGVVGGLVQIPFFALETLVGLIQAFIFAALTLVFTGVYTAHQDKMEVATETLELERKVKI
jgi:F-type H+-transporting ATPase subunit a